MGMSRVAFANKALDHLGKDSIASLTEAGTAARKVNAILDNVLEHALESSPWTFARTSQALASVTNDWAERWEYKYDKPNNMLRFIRIRPEDIDTPTSDPIPVALRGGAIYTNAENAVAEYVKPMTTTEDMPAYFLEAAAWLLARDLAMPLTRKMSFREMMQKEYDREWAKAVEIDASQEPHTYIRGNDYLQARGAGAADPWDDYNGADGSSYWR